VRRVRTGLAEEEEGKETSFVKRGGGADWLFMLGHGKGGIEKEKRDPFFFRGERERLSPATDRVTGLKKAKKVIIMHGKRKGGSTRSVTKLEGRSGLHIK